MPRIEELPDDFDTSINLNDVSSPSTNPSKQHGSSPAPETAAGITPIAINQSVPFPNSKLAPERDPNLPPDAPDVPMPPAMANTRAHTADELITLLNRTPLFMTELDETDGAGGSNTDLDALRALAYEGTRAQVADGFRERGNESVADKDWKNARDFYTRALNYLHGVGEEGRKAAARSAAAADSSLAAKIEGKKQWDRRTEDGKLDGGEGPAAVPWADTGDAPADWTPAKEAELALAVEEKCLTNRALANLNLQNYGACVRDCGAALRLNNKNVKAYYRSASALLALDKIVDAQDAINYCLSVDPENKPAEALAAKIDARKDYLAKLAKQRREREEREKRELVTLQWGLKARGYAVKMTANRPADVEDAQLSLEDPLDASSELTLPVLLLYPTAGQTDLLKAVSENHALQQHLNYILPLPWDEKAEFGDGDGAAVDLFADTVSGGMVKVGKKVPLREVLAGGKVVIADGLWRVYVVPKAKVGGWIEEVKKRKGRT